MGSYVKELRCDSFFLSKFYMIQISFQFVCEALLTDHFSYWSGLSKIGCGEYARKGDKKDIKFIVDSINSSILTFDQKDPGELLAC